MGDFCSVIWKWCAAYDLAVYIAAWLLSVYSEAENPLFGANLMGDGSCGDIFALVLL